MQGVDLTTEAGWAAARTMTVAQAKRRGFDSAHTAVTDADGRAYFRDLPVGLYLVTETAPGEPGTGYEGSAEFLITPPAGDDDGEHWNYDVEVYTKDTPAPTTTPTIPQVPTGSPGWRSAFLR